MSRYVLALLSAAALAPFGSADIPPPPGEKKVTVTYTFLLAKEVPDYAFFVIGFNPTPDVARLTLEPGKAVADKNAPRNGRFVAVPAKYAKGFKTDKDMAVAVNDAWLNGEPVPGVVDAAVSDRDVVPVAVKGTTLERRIVVTPTDGKPGLKVVTEDVTPKDEPKKDEPTASAPFGGKLMIAGLAAALAVVCLGLWIVRRK